jgi:hypothetical protein
VSTSARRRTTRTFLSHYIPVFPVKIPRQVGEFRSSGLHAPVVRASDFSEWSKSLQCRLPHVHESSAERLNKFRRITKYYYTIEASIIDIPWPFWRSASGVLITISPIFRISPPYPELDIPPLNTISPRM